MDRREFVGAGLAVTVGAKGPPGETGRGQTGRLIIDALGEVRIEYPMDVIDEIRGSGVRTCVVTVGNPAIQGPWAWDDTLAEIAAYEHHIDRHRDRFSRVRSVRDVEAAVAGSTIGIVYYPQNATALQHDVDRVDALYRHGVRIMQLTYNHRNLLGDGCLERTNAGLSEFGVEVVARMNEVGMLVDVSHCGPATTLDGIRFSRRPVAVTHAACMAVHEHPRNKTDQALRALADRGGVIGICQLNPFLGPRERNDLGDYFAHLDHAINVAGIEHVGIGSDREYRTIPDTRAERQKLADELSRLRPVTIDEVRWPFFLTELNHPRRMETIVEGLERRGRRSAEIDRIMGGNLLRVFRDTIG